MESPAHSEVDRAGRTTVDESTEDSRHANVLKSRIGRRLVMMFVGCALIPIVTLAIVSRHTVKTRLRSDADRMLHAQTKSIGQALAERLLRLERDLEIIGLSTIEGQDATAALSERTAKRVLEEFRSVTVVELQPDGAERVTANLYGSPLRLPSLDPAERTHLEDGRSLVRTGEDALELSIGVTTDDGPRVVRGQLTDDSLFGAFGVRPPQGVVHILTLDGRSLFDSDGSPDPAAVSRFRSAEGTIEWSDPHGEPLIGRAFRLFLEPRHRINWLIVHGRPKAELFAPIQAAESLLIGAALLAALCALGLSFVHIQRTLDPITRLMRGTRAVQAGRLEVRIDLNRSDEFGDLGDSFDEMVSALRVAIDRREQTERELRTARDDALRAARAQASFVTNVSHEFRTPVSCILSSAEVLKDFSDGDPDACREFSGLIVEEARHLTRLVEDTLALSGGDALASDLPTEPVDAEVAIKEAFDLRRADERDRLRFESEPNLPTFLGERRQIARLLDRLIDNALKFSPEDREVLVRTFTDGPDTLSIEVEDSGEGIHPTDQLRIFDRFVQVGRDERTDKARGTGIGLTLARRIAENHGGRITVDSEPGRGSTFRVDLPLQPAAQPTEASRS